MNFGITGVAAITVICYFAATFLKMVRWPNNRWLPIICGGLGGALGILGMAVMPSFPATDPLTALAVGIVSGFAPPASIRRRSRCGIAADAK